MTIFLSENILETSTLPPEESFHCAKVLRMRQNEEIQVIDGKGNLFTAKITVPDAKCTQIDIISVEKEFEKRGYYLHLAVAPTKNIDRFEWFVEKAVEIGVDCITPLVCRYSERKTVNISRLEKIIVSAAKQSLKAYLPKLNPITNFNDFITQTTENQRFIAHCYNTPKTPLFSICQPKQSTLVMIGAEGDFSEEEVKAAESVGFQSVSLGNARLRTETAGVAAVHTVGLINSL
ncbi:MAG: 16S rRNA (uracil(1498)-N(3))-methyltransferase [Prevotellaceae bacterium]|jgi:16S rRNA (uracil1498-N3)-methyltransferase|nr:16S rRNA (uracil(1498)-N(3))-methyltransferase [Prevotellaceae bacterium]